METKPEMTEAEARAEGTPAEDDLADARADLKAAGDEATRRNEFGLRLTGHREPAWDTAAAPDPGDFWHEPAPRRTTPRATRPHTFRREIHGRDRWDETTSVGHAAPVPTEISLAGGLTIRAAWEKALQGAHDDARLRPPPAEVRRDEDGRPTAKPPRGRRPKPWAFRPRVETWVEDVFVDDDLQVLGAPADPGHLAEPPGGANHGRKLGHRWASDRGRVDGPRAVSRALGDDDTEGAILARAGLEKGTWHIDHQGPTGNPVGRPATGLNLTQTQRERLLADLGLTAEQARSFYRPGRPSRAILEARPWVDARVAEMLDNGRGLGVAAVLANLLGVDERTLRKIADRGRPTETGR